MSWHPEGGGAGRPPLPSAPHKSSGDRHSLPYSPSAEESLGAAGDSNSSLSSSHANYMNFQSLQNLNSEPHAGYGGHRGSNSSDPPSGPAGLPASTSWHAGVPAAPSNQSLSSSGSGSETRPLRKGFAYSIGALESSPGERRREKMELSAARDALPTTSPVHASKSAYDLRQTDPQDSSAFRPHQTKHLMGNSWNRPGPYKASNYENVEAYESKANPNTVDVTGKRPSPNTMSTSYYMAERERLLGHAARHRSLDGGRDEVLRLSSAAAGETDLDAPAPLSPTVPAPPSREGSSMRWGRGAPSPTPVTNTHERFSSWPAAPVTASDNPQKQLSTSLNVQTTRVARSPSLSNSSQDYKSRTSFQSSFGSQREPRQENPKLKVLKDALEYPRQSALTTDPDRLTKSFSLDLNSDLEGKAPGSYGSYPFSVNLDAQHNGNKETYMEMAPVAMETEYSTKEVKLEKRFTDIPFIAKDLVRRESLRDSESSTPPPLPTSPPPLPTTTPPLPPLHAAPTPSPTSTQSSHAQQSFSAAQRSPLHAMYSTYLVRQTKPYYNTSTQTEEAAPSGATPVAAVAAAAAPVAEESPPQVECRSVEVKTCPNIS